MDEVSVTAALLRAILELKGGKIMKTYNVVTKTGRVLNMEPKTNLERAKWDTEVDAGLFGQTCHLVDVETGKIVFTAYPDEGHAFGEKEEESK